MEHSRDEREGTYRSGDEGEGSSDSGSEFRVERENKKDKCQDKTNGMMRETNYQKKCQCR